MAEQDLDKSEAATPYRLEEGRKRGSIGRSVDAIAALGFITAVFYVYGRGWQSLLDQARFDQGLLAQAGQGRLGAAQLWALMRSCIVETLSLLAPFLVALMIAALVGNMLQNRPTFTLKPLQPDWQRINPLRGFKRIFSMRTLYDTARALLKAGLLATVIYFALKELARQFYSLSNLTAAVYLHRLIDDIAALGFRVALMLVLLALLDLAYSRREFAKQMRMSRRELRDEVKHREGDPRIRARLRQLRLEALRRSLSVGKTGDGDVLITNPTHIAVSLRYQHGEMAAPVLVAKGAGLLAAAMRQIAARHGIPVVQSPSLARALYKQVDCGQAVPSALYAQVARILVWVLAMRERRASADGGVASAASSTAASSTAPPSTAAAMKAAHS